jgi:hypothetical protein
LTTLVSGSQTSAFACSSLLPQATSKRISPAANSGRTPVLCIFMAIPKGLGAVLYLIKWLGLNNHTVDHLLAK